MEQDSDPPPTPRRGGWRAIKYILGNESFEKLASMSLIGNLTVYLRTQYNMGGMLLVNVVSIWSGTSNVSSLAGAFLSDVYVGKFLTFLIGSIASMLGMGIIALGSGVQQLRPPSCDGQSHCIPPQRWQLGILFTGLGLLAIGAGCIRPCNIAFGADQFDTSTEKGKSQLASFFNWWYFSFTVALLIALTGVIYVQTNISWMIGFVIPTACLALSIIIFLIGRHTYIYKKPQGSVFVELAKVIVAAVRKRKLSPKKEEHSSIQSSQTCQYHMSNSDPHMSVSHRQTMDTECMCFSKEDGGVTYYDPPLNQELQYQISKLTLTKKFECLNKAALITDPSELDGQGKPINSWRLCSVHQVEQLKLLVGIVPVWVSGICCFVVVDQQHTFGMLQAMQMNKSVGPHFKIPPAWMSIVAMTALSICILIYERVYVPSAKKIMKRDPRLTLQQRIRTGILITIVCMVVSGVVEKKRRDSALKHDSFVSPLSIGFLVPQFALSGLSEAFASVAIMEYYTTELPESLRSVAGAIFFLSLSFASYLTSIIVNVIHAITGINGKTPWLGGHDLNKNHLEYLYFTIAVLSVVNLIYFTFFASRYVSSGKSIDKGGELKLEKSTV